MGKYKINYAELYTYNKEEFYGRLEGACSYANFTPFPSVEGVLAIIGIIPSTEEEVVHDSKDEENGMD